MFRMETRRRSADSFPGIRYEVGCFAEIVGERSVSEFHLIVEGKQGGVKPELSSVERPVLQPELWE